MTSQEGQRHLERACERLQETIDLMIARPQDISRCYKQLQQTAQSLEIVRKNAPAVLSGSLALPLRTIRGHLTRLEHLLNTAATFYCASVSSQVAHGGTYTQDGALQPSVGSSSLRLEA